MEDIETDRGVSRRDVLKGMGLGGVIGYTGGMPTGRYLADTWVGDRASDRIRESMFYEGVPEDYREDDGFYSRLNDYFPADQVRRLESAPNMIVDVRYIEGCSLSEDDRTKLEQDFIQNGVDTIVLEYEEKYPREDFFDNYSMDANDILGEGVYRELLGIQNGFWGDKTEDFLKDTAVQVLFVPGLIDGELNFIESSDGAAAGVAKGSRSAVRDMRDTEYRYRVTKHEIGHMLSLEHTEGNDVMTGTQLLGQHFEEWQWEKIREQLS